MSEDKKIEENNSENLEQNNDEIVNNDLNIEDVFNINTQDTKEDNNVDLVQELLNKRIITQDQLDVAQKEQAQGNYKENISAVLVRMGFVSQSTISEILNKSSDMKNFDIKSIVIDQSLIKKVPKTFAIQNLVVPIHQKDDVITIAIADIFNIITLDQIKRFFPPHFKIKPVYVAESDIMNIINQYYDYEMSIDGILKEIESDGSNIDDNDSMQGNYQSPMVRLVDALLTDAVRVGASDLHFEPETFFLRLRYRIDGKMEQIRAFHKDYWSSIAVRIKIMSGMNIAETRKSQDGRINVNILGRNIDFRVSSQPTIDGENIVMRILDEKSAILSLDKLGYTERSQKIIRKCIQRPEGIIIITGPTGSGKTTTLYTLLNMINTIDKNIMTLENPVEYRLPIIRQSNINPEIGCDFADGIRTLLRQDPDVILVGEIRDKETAIAAVQAAMTGHQVYSSLHTNDAFSAIPRLMQIGVEPYLLSGSLICVMAQRLTRKLCPYCKEAYEPSDYERRVIRKIAGEEVEKSVKVLYREKGCDKCRHNGTIGRMCIVEIIDVDKELDEMIVSKATKKQFLTYLESKGFITMQHDGILKVIEGIISFKELCRVVDMTQYMELEEM